MNSSALEDEFPLKHIKTRPSFQQGQHVYLPSGSHVYSLRTGTWPSRNTGFTH